MSDSYRQYVLAELRAAYHRAKLAAHDIAEVGAHLKQGAIAPDQAMQELADLCALQFVQPKQPTPTCAIADAMVFFYPWSEEAT